ncbi:MAG: hypothetical protein U5R30_20695 [Deltaproteobacteria bacterium]|nr:hypothetical protein [Deltaproteobacteria bacterium]
MFWESERSIDIVFTFLKNKREVDGVQDPALERWIDRFERDKHGAALRILVRDAQGRSRNIEGFSGVSGWSSRRSQELPRMHRACFLSAENLA